MAFETTKSKGCFVFRAPLSTFLQEDDKGKQNMTSRVKSPALVHNFKISFTDSQNSEIDDLQTDLTDFYQNNFKLYSSDLLQTAITSAMMDCPLYTKIKSKGTGKTKKNKLDLLIDGASNIISSVYSNTHWIVTNESDIKNYDRYFCFHVKNPENRNAYVNDVFTGADGYRHGNVETHPLYKESLKGWVSVYHEDKKLLVYHRQNLPLIKKLIEHDIIESRQVAIKGFDWKRTEYRINPKYHRAMTDATYTDKCINAFIKTNQRWYDRHCASNDENVIEHLNIMKYNYNITEEELRNHLNTNWLGTTHKGKPVDKRRIESWINRSMDIFNDIKTCGKGSIPYTKDNKYRRSTPINRLPKACREFFCIKNDLVEYDASSMHFNTLLLIFTESEFFGRATNEERKHCFDLYGDSKQGIADKLGIDRGDIKTRLNTFIYSSLSNSRNSKLGKWFVSNMPQLVAMCEDIKKNGGDYHDKHNIVDYIYPVEYNFITRLMVDLNASGYAGLTVHDAILIPNKSVYVFMGIVDVVKCELNITSNMVKSDFKMKEKKPVDNIDILGYKLLKKNTLKEFKTKDSIEPVKKIEPENKLESEEDVFKFFVDRIEKDIQNDSYKIDLVIRQDEQQQNEIKDANDDDNSNIVPMDDMGAMFY